MVPSSSDVVRRSELKRSIALSWLSEQYKCNEMSAGLRELGLRYGGLELIGEPKLAEWEESKLELMREEAKLVGRRGELIRELAELIRRG
ncbi:hypothetical protein Pyn_39770 [Prunus yedoensis var. nudiflora]|uniref:Uncharacterized protein n=1 Tax=Prunus yedoensis var. nudiflora TaxID=2094558 RepID=A0A314XJW1_PRUYE|nr:hypothetical protein Pyn_39770 [Prunus yedoensis var. nudiflora]